MKPISKFDQLMKLLIGSLFALLGTWLGLTTQNETRLPAAFFACLASAAIIWFALYEPTNKHRPGRSARAYRKTQFVSLALAIVAVASLGVRAYRFVAVNEPPYDGSHAHQPYKYAYMAKNCSDGASAYRKKRESITNESNRIVSEATAQAESLMTEAKSHSNSQDVQYREAMNDFSNAYEQGYISYDEWSRRVDSLGALPDNAREQELSASATAHSLISEAKRKVESNTRKLDEINVHISRLESCVDTANTSRDFTSSEVAELQALIDNTPIHPSGL